MSTQSIMLEEKENPASRKESSESGPARPAAFKKGSAFRRMLPVFLAVLAIGTISYWLLTRGWESTDDAQIDGHIYSVSSRIAGNVQKVYADDGDFVKAGTLLLEIDPRDYEIAVQRARADYDEAIANAKAAGFNTTVSASESETQISNAQSDILSAEAAANAARKQVDEAAAKLISAQANARNANLDVQRYAPLVAKKEISQQRYDQAVAAADSANATVAAAEAAQRSSLAQVQQAEARIAQARAGLQNARVSPKQVAATREKAQSAGAQMERAKAELDQRVLNLSYTKVVAPVDGIVGSRSVQVGQNLASGQALMVVVPVEDLWVTANFKETQLRNMHPGQEAEVDVDAFGTNLHGRIDSVGAATGARFSMFPPENATGNFVKVVQRIPVRIELSQGQNSDHRLRPGMSVVAKVKVR
ncbi:MAG TPA: HlyD family secretion protein [Terriglobales bacterium]|nr:HlyD family secretion protein [Terriglobales bacterium]